MASLSNENQPPTNVVFSRSFPINKYGQAESFRDYRLLEWRESEIGLCLFLTEEMTGKALEQIKSGAAVLACRIRPNGEL